MPAELQDPRFAILSERITTDMKRLKVPGAAVAVWHAGQKSAAGFGKTSVEHPLPVTPETLFQVGSISKTFTGTLLMMLAEQGKLDLDAPVKNYLPELKLSDPEVTAKVTTRHLLTHTGGWIGDYFNNFGNGDDALAKMVASLDQLPQVTPLGSLWSYNNAGFNIAGRLVEVLTGQPYEQAARAMLFEPLGLEMSFFYPDDVMITHRFVSGHQKIDNKARVARPWAIGRAGNCVGGVVSTVRDLIKYAQFHMGTGQGIASEGTLKSMRLPHADAGGRGQMGITWFINRAGDREIFGHGGATHGQQAVFYFIPKENFAATLLTNSDEGGVITGAFLKWILELYFKTSIPTPEPSQRAKAELTKYTGRYDLPLSCFDLGIDNGYLVLQDIPRGGFPTPDSPPGPPQPPVRLAFYETDRVIGIDEPMKGSRGEFFRDANGKLEFFRIGGRAHPKVA